MPPRLLQLLLFAAAAATLWAEAADLPSKVYGVNLGSWLVVEPWMLDGDWVNIGGQFCDDCTKCISSESAYAKAFPNKVDSVFNEHWNSWFNQSDVQQLVSAGINTVRIPLGYWIIEPLVNRTTEHYVRGGFAQLVRGLGLLKDAGIVAILELHGAPGVQVPNQPFTGLCTGTVQFYTQYNYHRALIWTAVLTTFNHLVPEFSNVVAIQAVNEPLMDAALTPDYGTYQTHFVQVVRAVEHALGLSVPKLDLPKPNPHMNVTAAFEFAIQQGIYDAEVRSVLQDSMPILLEMAGTFLQQGVLNGTISNSSPSLLTTTFMDVDWQFNHPSNPAKAAIGSQLYDNHLYLSFGNVTNADPMSYLAYVCNLGRVTRDGRAGDTPLIFGEWSLTTGFIATDSFLKQWADAQKLAYSQGRGWMFWNFKTKGNSARQWSYLEGVHRGYFTKDPALLHDPHVCDPFRHK